MIPVRKPSIMARTGADRYLMTMPMFHVGGTGVVNCMTFRAGSLAVVPSFDTESFWSLVRRTEATVVFLLGAIASFLWKRPPGPPRRDLGRRAASASRRRGLVASSTGRRRSCRAEQRASVPA